ncbi:hypothetical protein SAMN02910292_02077 [Lachnospiraceae bacterium XBB2008]|nr:hypothetical protein SAMN02910292_02077 [Lachnospiraceae bacterium XBB2008]
MKKTFVKRMTGLLLGAVLVMGALSGCGKSSDAPVFTKGVYVNYREGATTRDYYYVFYDEGAGYTEDGNNGIGVPFSCEQKGNKVVFSFGGEDEEAREEFVVKSVENGVIEGEFDSDGIVLYFEPLMDVDPQNFDAMAYYAQFNNPSGETVYNDPNGWSVRYYADNIEVNTSGNVTTFVYTGESAGTNMVTVTYEVSKTAEEYVNELAESWGKDNVTLTKSTFPGTEDVDGYWAVLPPEEGGSGLYEQAIARDYMDGTLVFELTGHNSGDEAMDMAVSDSLAMIIDSLTFENAQ